MYEPVQAVLIWPAAGIGIATALVWGVRVLPALYLAELTISLLFYQNPDFSITLVSFLKSNAFILAGILRSYLGAYLIRYFIGYPNAFVAFKPILKFYLILAPLATFLSTLVYTLIKFIFNYVSPNTFIENFISWWFGDLLGFILFVPLTLLFIAQPKSIWKARRLTVGVPIILLFFSTIFFYNKSIVSENHDIIDKLELKNEIISANLNKELQWIEQFKENISSKIIDSNRDTFHLKNYIREEITKYQYLDAITLIINGNINFITISEDNNNELRQLSSEIIGNKTFFQSNKIKEEMSLTRYNEKAEFFINKLNIIRNDSNIQLIIYHHFNDQIISQLQKYNIENTRVTLILPLTNKKVKLQSSHFRFPDNEISTSCQINFMNEEWQLNIEPTSEYLIRNHSYSSTLIAKTSFLFTGFISIMLMILTGKTVLNEIKIKDRTLELDTQTKKLRSSKKQYQNLVEHHPVILWRLDINKHKMTYISKKVENVFGFPLMNWLSIKDFWANQIHPEDQQLVQETIDLAIKNKKNFTLQYRIIKSNNSIAWIKDVVNTIIENNEVTQLVGLMIDNSNEQQAIEKTTIIESKYQSLFQYSVDPLIILDIEKFFIKDVNNKAITLFGKSITRKKISLSNFSPLKQTDGSFTKKTLLKYLKKFSQHKVMDFELLMLNKKGEKIICQIEMVKLPEEFLNSALVSINDITKQKKHEKKINKLAYYDTLTTLPNRQYFYSKLEYFHQLAIEQNLFGCLIYLDLDRFKILNDSMGHQTGDQLLKIVAKRIKRVSKKKNFSARLAGDEFIILTKDLKSSIELTLESSLLIAETILESLNEPYQLGDYEHFITPSIGISVFPSEDNSIDQIIHHADIAMYTSKKKGKNTITVYQNKMIEHVQHKLIIEKAIKEAFEKGEFKLKFQPQFDKNLQISSVEALLRWDRLSEFLITTEELIETIENIGMIHELGFWVFDKACWQLNQWNKEKNPIKAIAINVSAKQFHQRLFIEQIKSIIESYEVEPHQVFIELTEAVIIEDFVVLVRKLNELKAYGVKISLDDFGTGYSSLAYLKYLPIDQLKIDKLFINDVTKEQTSKFIIKTIIDLARSLGIELVVEGIETQEQFEVLKELGCEIFQGFYFSRAKAGKNITRNTDIVSV